MPAPNDLLDCLIVGGGPAGLTAAVYLTRFRRSVRVIDSGASRARLIPRTRNYPGFPDGISGPDLLDTLRQQAIRYGAHIEEGEVTALAFRDGLFTAEWAGSDLVAKRVLLATGIVDEAPDIPGLREVVYEGAIRFCPICDGYEAMDRKIGVLGAVDIAWKKALFMRAYSKDVTLLRIAGKSADEACLGELRDAGVALSRELTVDVERDGDAVRAVFGDGSREHFDIIYPALGCEVRSRLGTSLGANSTDIGLLHVNDCQRTSVEGLYAAGDVVTDLHQISVATGHAAIAATDIHNSLEPNPR
jgi:thioredoxin reductase (NADPH)